MRSFLALFVFLLTGCAIGDTQTLSGPIVPGIDQEVIPGREYVFCTIRPDDNAELAYQGPVISVTDETITLDGAVIRGNAGNRLSVPLVGHLFKSTFLSTDQMDKEVVLPRSSVTEIQEVTEQSPGFYRQSPE